MDDVTDTGVSGIVSSITGAEGALREKFKATEVQTDTYGDSVAVQMEFSGFEDLNAALDRAYDVASYLHDLDQCNGVNISAHIGEAYSLHDEEEDPRPAAHVSAKFEVGE